MKTPTLFHRSLFGLLCVLLSGWSSLRVAAQSCPPLSESDFSYSLVQPNVDCNLPGSVTVSYRNNVVGVSHLTYAFGTGAEGPWFATVKAAAPGATVRQELPATLNGQPLFVRATATCGGDTRVLTFNAGSVSVQKSESFLLLTESTPTGSSAGTSGSVQARIAGTAGCTEATFKLYRSNDLNTPLAEEHSTKPYRGVTFFNLPLGDYVVQAEAKPACAVTSGANWENDHFLLRTSAAVTAFRLLLTPTRIASIPTCAPAGAIGTIKVETSKIAGVSQLTYRLTTVADPATVLQTQTVSAPHFTHTFTGLGLGTYRVTAFEQADGPQVVAETEIGRAAPTPTVEVKRPAYPGVPALLKISLPGVAAACPVTYTVTPYRPAKLTLFTPIVREHVTESEITVETPHEGRHKLVTEAPDGQTFTSFFDVPKQDVTFTFTETAVDHTTKLHRVVLSSNPFDRPLEVRLSKNGKVVKTEHLTLGQTEYSFQNQAYQYDKVALYYDTYEVAAHSMIAIQAALQTWSNANLTFEVVGSHAELCHPEPMVKLSVKCTAADDDAHRTQLNNATLVFADRTLPMPQLVGSTAAELLLPPSAMKDTVTLQLPGGESVKRAIDNYRKDLGEFRVVANFAGNGDCGSLQTTATLQVTDVKGESLKDITLVVRKKGSDTPVGTYPLTGEATVVTLPNFEVGDYEVEWFPACQPTQKHRGTFTANQQIEGRVLAFPATCNQNNGSIVCQLHDATTTMLHYELLRKSDRKLLQVFNTRLDGTFTRLEPGEYIVRVSSAAGCENIFPKEYEATVPAGAFERFEIKPLSTSAAEYSVYPYVERIKWRVYDPATGELLTSGTAQPERSFNGERGIFRLEDLPGEYRIDFSAPCINVTRHDQLIQRKLIEEYREPGFEDNRNEYTVTEHWDPATQTKSIHVHYHSERGTKLIQLDIEGESGVEGFPKKIEVRQGIQDYTFANLDPWRKGRYWLTVGNYYRWLISNDFKLDFGSCTVDEAGNAVIPVNISDQPDGSAELVVKDESGAEVHRAFWHTSDKINYRNVYQYLQFKMKDPKAKYYLEGKVLTGPYAGRYFAAELPRPQQIEGRNNAASATDAKDPEVKVVGKPMRCQNDGVIEAALPADFPHVDHVRYTLRQLTGERFTTAAETTTPEKPLQFVGLVPGVYELTTRTTLFKDENNQPKVQEFKNRVVLTSTYRTLGARVRADYMVSSFKNCPSGRIGLEITDGAKPYRVFLTSTPDEGKLAEPREIFTDRRGEYAEKQWGEGLKAGHYALLVSDGCMEINIPDAEITEVPEVPNLAKLLTPRLTLSSPTLHTPDEVIDSIDYRITFDPERSLATAIPEAFRKKFAMFYEAQVVPKGEEPDEQKWNGDWAQEIISSKREVSALYGRGKYCADCKDFEVLFRLKHCPTEITRVPTKLAPYKPKGHWEQYQCNRFRFVFTEAEIGVPYKIQVRGNTQTQTNQILLEKTVTFRTHEDYLRFDPELDFTFYGNHGNLRMLMYYVEKGRGSIGVVDVINYSDLQKDYKFDYHTDMVFQQCRENSVPVVVYVDKNCRPPLKFFAFDESDGNKLVAESDGYLEGEWACPYPLKDGHTYRFAVQEAGGTEYAATNPFTPIVEQPSSYRLEQGTWSKFSFNGDEYDATQKGYPPYLLVRKVEPQFKRMVKYRGVPPIKIVAQQKEAPQRKFVAEMSDFGGSNPNIVWADWLEEKPDGKLEKAYFPEGEYDLSVRTECGDTPLGTDVLARPVFDLSATKIETVCGGKYKITPKGTITYRGSTEDVEFVSYYIEDDPTSTTRNWGEESETYLRKFNLVVNYRRKSDKLMGTMKWPFTMPENLLEFDRSQAVSLFCTGSDKGIINVALKGGQPPYTYKLQTLSGTELETKTADGGVTFLNGALGQRYVVKATDACGLTWIQQDVLLQDAAAVSSSMVERKSYCAGDHVKMGARAFPGATYSWQLPDGSTREGREIDFVANEQNAGVYKVDIKLTDCTVTLNAKITVRIVSLQEAAAPGPEQTICAGGPVEFTADAATGSINGEPIDEDEIEYQWEMTTTPDEEDSWTAIDDAVEQNLRYVASRPGVYYVRRTAIIDECKAIGGKTKLTVGAGVNVSMTADERTIVRHNREPFTLTAGTVDGNDPRTYQWQRSLDKKTWENVGTEATYTEKNPLERTVFYRRLITSLACTYEGEPITVRFKRPKPAYINPHLRQRTMEH